MWLFRTRAGIPCTCCMIVLYNNPSLLFNRYWFILSNDFDSSSVPAHWISSTSSSSLMCIGSFAFTYLFTFFIQLLLLNWKLWKLQNFNWIPLLWWPQCSGCLSIEHQKIEEKKNLSLHTRARTHTNTRPLGSVTCRRIIRYWLT